VLHACCCTFADGGGHASPPFAAGLTMLRVDCCTPVLPHVDTLHDPNTLHALITQSCTTPTGGATIGDRVGGPTTAHVGATHAC